MQKKLLIFMWSIEKHNITYTSYVGDGDSWSFVRGIIKGIWFILIGFKELSVGHS